MSGLRVARGLALPVDVAGETIAILAKRGAGKTNTAKVLVEEMVGGGVQTVILDPVGAWWGIRSSADGKSGGLAVPVLGGAHGDVPLEATSGALIADVAVDTGQSLLVDLSDLPSKAQMARFVTDFSERLFRRKASERHLLHLVLEEADSFAPQKVHGDTARMAGAIEQIVRRGRSRGLGVTLVTQRSAVLNKDVLTQADVLIVMRTTGPQDVKAIKEWIASHGDDGADKVLASLPSLETGEAWIWNPERSLLERVKVRRAHTFDSSSTPKAGERKKGPRALFPVDLEQLGAEIAATAERAKENDPRELRRRIADLERELARKPSEQIVREVEVIVEKPIFTREDRETLRTIGGSLSSAVAAITKAEEATNRLLSDLEQRTNGHKEVAHGSAQRTAAGQTPPRTPRPAPAPRREPADARGARAGAQRDVRQAAEVSSSQQRILDALAWFEIVGVPEPSRAALAPLAGSRSTSGGFKNNLGALRNEKGVYEWPPLIDYPQPNRVALTDAGRELAATPDIEPTDEALQEAVLAILTGSQRSILRTLIGEYPNALPREELAAAVGSPVTSGGFKNNLGALRTLELIDYPQAGLVVALPILFPSER